MWKSVPRAIHFSQASSVFWIQRAVLIASGKNTPNLKINKFGRFIRITRLLRANCPPVGGQAVMEGVMMRYTDMYSVAVRQEGGGIVAQRLPWRTLVKRPWLRLPFIRGFPILLDSMINGIHALNLSARLCGEPEEENQSGWNVALSLFLAIVMAIALFVLAPHLLSLLMLFLHLGGDVDGLSFHLWDGFYKCAIFISYIWAISLVPGIRRVFEYHGAEHKTIHAWEKREVVSGERTCQMSRLHPRCGTTFLLFVICVSIIIQAILVPFFLMLWTPSGMAAKHALSLFYKLLLVIPISAVSYEILRYAARLPDGFWGKILRAPGLALQRLTTREPDSAQVEVAVVALAVALGQEGEDRIQPPRYSRLPASF